MTGPGQAAWRGVASWEFRASKVMLVACRPGEMVLSPAVYRSGISEQCTGCDIASSALPINGLPALEDG